MDNVEPTTGVLRHFQLRLRREAITLRLTRDGVRNQLVLHRPPPRTGRLATEVSSQDATKLPREKHPSARPTTGVRRRTVSIRLTHLSGRSVEFADAPQQKAYSRCPRRPCSGDPLSALSLCCPLPRRCGRRWPRDPLGTQERTTQTENPDSTARRGKSPENKTGQGGDRKTMSPRHQEQKKNKMEPLVGVCTKKLPHEKILAK